jgi:hypothetical protein
MTAKIRAAVLGDEELLARLNSFVHDLHVQRRPDHFKQSHPPELAGWYRSLLEKPGLSSPGVHAEDRALRA